MEEKRWLYQFFCGTDEQVEFCFFRRTNAQMDQSGWLMLAAVVGTEGFFQINSDYDDDDDSDNRIKIQLHANCDPAEDRSACCGGDVLSRVF